MNTDAWCFIGKPHVSMGTPCEDYAMTGGNNERQWAFVSDGCSGADGRTDIGSRVFCMAADAALAAGEDMREGVLSRIKQWNLPVTYRDMMATLLAVWSDGEQIHLRGWGDGAIMIRLTNGQSVFFELEWKNDMPYYLYYEMTPDFKKLFIEKHGDFDFSVRKSVMMGEQVEVFETFYNTIGAMSGFEMSIPVDGIESVTVFSDGVGRVGDMSAMAAAAEATAYKNTTGSFQKRRMIRAMKEWEKAGHVLQDDFSCASIVFGEQP